MYYVHLHIVFVKYLWISKIIIRQKEKKKKCMYIFFILIIIIINIIKLHCTFIYRNIQINKFLI